MNLIHKFLLKGSLIGLTALLLSIQVNAEEILWQSGKSLHIKIDTQDEPNQGQAKPNEHPVKLEASNIVNALKAIKIYDRKNKFKSVFSIQQATLLGKYLANGLSKAEPDQDILFALAKTAVSYAVMKETYYMAGRAFYVNGRLNIIIGDYDRLSDKFRERANASHGKTGGVFYFFKPGERAKPSKFKERLITKEGITTKRRDWFIIDVEKASTAYIAEKNRNRKPTTQETVDLAIQEEAKKLAKERREMRFEMARLRKEMNKNSQSKGALSAEDRLKKLEELKDEKLITEDEYNMKRKEILNDI